MGQKLTDWERRLILEVEAREKRPFEWGENDCAMFMVALVEAMTGRRVWCRPYSTAREACELVTESGGLAAMLHQVARRERWERVTRPAFGAQRGDPVELVDGACRTCLGVCLGPHAATAGEHGMQTLPLRNIVTAYRIPNSLKPCQAQSPPLSVL